MSAMVLVVDDEAAIRLGIGEYLRARGYRVQEAESCQSALSIFEHVHCDAALLDYSLPDGNAVGLLERFQQIDPEVPVILLTAYGTIDLAVEAIQKGAAHFFTKPIQLSGLEIILERAVQTHRDRRQQRAYASQRARRRPDPFIGSSSAIRRLAEEAALIASSAAPILLQGETGTGKGVLASWLHSRGPRPDEAFVDLNCAGLSKELLESELFGYEKGAFTGAAARKPGLLEVEHRGTLFLDEIGDLDVQVQPKLLKVLEEGIFRPLGGVAERRVDIRLIAATNQDLPRLAREGRFRSDLYYRISTILLNLPPLRERREDIVPLACHLLPRLSRRRGVPPSLSAEAEEKLHRYDWPGNIRELRNSLERAALLAEGDEVTADHLRFDEGAIAPRREATSLTLEEVERQHIERVLAQEHGNVGEAARLLGIARSTLYERMKHFDARGGR